MLSHPFVCVLGTEPSDRHAVCVWLMLVSDWITRSSAAPTLIHGLLFNTFFSIAQACVQSEPEQRIQQTFPEHKQSGLRNISISKHPSSRTTDRLNNLQSGSVLGGVLILRESQLVHY